MTCFEQFSYLTSRIECTLSNGNFSIGTSFFFGFSKNEEKIICLVTNRHVIENAVNAHLRMSLKDSAGNPILNTFEDITIPDITNKCIMHPSADVDLCILPMNDIVNQYSNNGKYLYYASFDESNIPTEEVKNTFDAVEDIYMVGYPDALCDIVNNKPLIRKGITATNYCVDWNGKREFIVDLPVYSGSSGSPIILYDRNHVDKATGMLKGGTRCYLLGINHSTFIHEEQATLCCIPTPTTKLSVNINIPNQLGLIAKSECLLDFKSLL